MIALAELRRKDLYPMRTTVILVCLEKHIILNTHKFRTVQI